MKTCKICNNELINWWQDTYCSNKCKFSDSELNAKRARKEKNDASKRLKCIYCGKILKDILNLAGQASIHLIKSHSITDSYHNHYMVIDAPIIKTWNCPECEWKTKDLDNISGWITTHIKNKHNLSIYEFNEKYPDLQLHSIRFDKKELSINNGISCKICGEKLLFITNSHLKLHNITQHEYKKKFGKNIISLHTKEKLEKCGGTKDFSFISKAENEINSFLNSQKINTIQSYKKEGPEIDIYIPEVKIGIEYNGLYWHSEFSNEKDKNYHIGKTNYYDKIGIRIIHIFEDEWIHNKDILKSKLLHIFNIKTNSKSIYARNCIIKNITTKQKNEFLNKNHIQGTDKSNIFFGLFSNDTLISVITFTRPRISLGNKNKNSNEYELSRFAVDINFNAVGAFSKLLKHFIRERHPEKIYSYADFRYTSKYKNVYLANGFKFVSLTKPNYFYVNGDGYRYHRYNFAKHRILKLGAKVELSEIENMIEMGYDRIWDCGSLKYEMDLARKF